jgi:putative DNA-invertase from lambdoid prophage Rac
MVIYGYLRVSTGKQNEVNFKMPILDYANEHKLGNVEWIQETISGRKKVENRLLGQKFTDMSKGDVIIMGEYSRISRDFIDGLNFVSKCREKGIRLISLNNDIPPSDSATDNLILCLTAWKSQLERENISYRTKIGLRKARESGKKLGGGHFKLKDADINDIQNSLKIGVKKNSICKKYNITFPTLNDYIKRMNINVK